MQGQQAGTDKYRMKEKTKKQLQRQATTDTAFKRKKAFLSSIRSGRIFFCVCCHRKLHQIQVVELEENWQESIEEQYPGLVKKFIGPIPHREVYLPSHRNDEPQLLSGDYVCHTCKKYLEQNKMPPMCNMNNLQFVDVRPFPELQLSELEQQLISLNILFQKIVLLPKSRMNALKDKIVSVPINPSDVMETLTKLPRTPTDASLSVIQLKRRLNFSGVHNEQLIDIRKVIRALRVFISMKNPHYQNVLEDQDFKQRCFQNDPEGYNILFPEEEIDLSCLEINSQKSAEDLQLSDLQINSQKLDQDHNAGGLKSEDVDEEDEYKRLDPIGRSQFNYNRSTCFGENHPEIHIEENISHPTQVAPGQGKVPKSILQEKDFEVKSFPCLFPDGSNGKDEERKVPLSDQAYWGQRILNVDERCGSSPAYVFTAAAHTELKQMTRNINLSFQKGLEKVNPDGSCVYSLEDPYMVLDNIKNTPRYWKKARQELYAKLENLGPFTFFFTLSCADMRWSENFTSLLEGHKITFECIEGNEEFYIDDKPLDEFLKNYPSKHEFIKNNLLNATLNFQHRLRMFLKHIMLSKGSQLTLSHYNYRIEFQLRGAPHAHGTLWMDWKRFSALPRSTVDKIEKAFGLIKGGEQLDDEQKQALTQFADLFVSVSLMNPATSSIVNEVNVHHHTKRACKKYGTNCRFNFPRFPIHRTIISAPSNITYPCETERKNKMKQHTIVLEGVKEVLEDMDKLQDVCSYKKEEIDAIWNERQLKWRIQKLIIEEGMFNKSANIHIPENLHPILKDIVDEFGFALIKDLQIEEEKLQNHDDSLTAIIEDRVGKLLEQVDPEKIDVTEPLMPQYVEALSVNKKGYSIHYRRDINETMVNPHNPEWITAWNGNMDFQLCLDYFAVITYISDYYCKDDSGTMKTLQEALKESMNEDLRSRLKKMVSVFLTHRQMGESEAYYRIIPNMHMKDSNIKAVFAQTGFNPSRFLEKVDDNDLDQCEKVVEVEGRVGKYQEKPSLYDKYLRRNCKIQPQLSKLCYAQFVKRYSSVGKMDDTFDVALSTVKKIYDHNGNAIFENHIVTHDYDDQDYAVELPKFIIITDLKPGELPYMKLRTPQVLRYHKFNREKTPHEYYYSELQLYFPHTNKPNANLLQEKDDITQSIQRFNTSNISNVKGKIMPFLESVEEGLKKAEELIQNTAGDDLDPQGEQDRTECEGEGVAPNPDFVLCDPGHLEKEVETTTTGLFKTVTLSSDSELEELTENLDDDQRLALGLVLNYARQLKISRSKPEKVNPPMLVVQGGAGAGKSLLIKAMGQWFEKELQQSGDDPNKPYVLITAFTGTAAANVDGMTLHSAFNFNFGNEFLSLGDKIRDAKREQLKNLRIVIIDEFSMLKADMFYQLDLRLRELKQNTEEVFGGCSLILLGDILQLRPVMGRYIFEQPLCVDYHLPHLIDPLWMKMQVLLLTFNHRQGEDFAYAEILNRLRSGSHTDADCKILEQRVRPTNHPDIPTDALFIICTNAGVNARNEIMLENMEGDCVSFKAQVTRAGKAMNNPKKSRDGAIFNTPLQSNLNLKIGAQVMLTFNVDVMDSLTNGTIGHVIGYERTSEGTVQDILVQFQNEKSGRERRKKVSTELARKFPNNLVTPISRIEFRFNMSKSPTSQNDFMMAVQFPLKLSFACTAHKMQGSTVLKPDSLAIDLKSVREPAQAYVMMSRVQALDQLFILEEFPRGKVFPSEAAMEELKRLTLLALNDQRRAMKDLTLISSLNIRSLLCHHRNLSKDPNISGNVIALQETWCEADQDNCHLCLPGYELSLVSHGRGKGIATYFKPDFQETGTVNESLYQIARVSSKDVDVINVYLSRGANKANFLRDLGSLAKGSKPCLIVGDFNLDYLGNPNETIIKKITSCNFKQIVSTPTHIQGGLLDHVYVKHQDQEYQALVNFPYYSDHAIISVCKS